MVIHTANRPSHERETMQKPSLQMKLHHKYSLVGFEPSGTLAPHLGLQDI